LELSSTCALENNIERALLFSSSTTSCTRSSNSNSCSSGFNTVLFLEDSCKFVYFFYSKIFVGIICNFRLSFIVVFTTKLMKKPLCAMLLRYVSVEIKYQEESPPISLGYRVMIPLGGAVA